MLASQTTLSSNVNHDKSHFQLAVCNQPLVSALALCSSEDGARSQDMWLCVHCARFVCLGLGELGTAASLV